jgi:hypothetical protein
MASCQGFEKANIWNEWKERLSICKPLFCYQKNSPTYKLGSFDL